MKIAWFSPFYQKSAIGKFTQAVTEILNQKVKIDLWLDHENNLLPSTVNKIFYTSQDSLKKDILELLDHYDFIIYNMGNYLPYHKNIYSVLQQKPGIVIFHDYIYHHFFLELYYATNPDKYFELLEIYYGKKCRALFENSLKSGSIPVGFQEAGEARASSRSGAYIEYVSSEMSAQQSQNLKSDGYKKNIWQENSILINYPLFEPLVKNNYGFITHSNWVAEKINQFIPERIQVLRLPFFILPSVHNDSIPVGFQEAGEARASSRSGAYIQYVSSERSTQQSQSLKGDKYNTPKTKIRLLSYGHMNSTRGIENIVELLNKNSEIAHKIQYDVIGEFGDKAYQEFLINLINSYSLQEIIHFHDYVDDAKLYQYLKDADICINLRYPAMESASASLIEQMYFGKAIMVTDTGSYSEFPTSVINKVTPNDPMSLEKSLINLVENIDLRNHLAQNSKNYVVTHHSPRQYADKLILYLREIYSLLPGIKLINTVSKELKNMGAKNFMSVIDKTSLELNNILRES